MSDKWVSALDLDAMRTKWSQKKAAIDVRDMMEVIALADALRARIAEARSFAEEYQHGLAISASDSMKKILAALAGEDSEGGA